MPPHPVIKMTEIRAYYKMNFDCMKRGHTWPIHFVYDKEDFVNGRAPAFAWDEVERYGCAIYSLNQTSNIVGWP